MQVMLDMVKKSIIFSVSCLMEELFVRGPQKGVTQMFY